MDNTNSNSNNSEFQSVDGALSVPYWYRPGAKSKAGCILPVLGGSLAAGIIYLIGWAIGLMDVYWGPVTVVAGILFIGAAIAVWVFWDASLESIEGEVTLDGSVLKGPMADDEMDLGQEHHLVVRANAQDSTFIITNDKDQFFSYVFIIRGLTADEVAKSFPAPHFLKELDPELISDEGNLDARNPAHRDFVETLLKVFVANHNKDKHYSIYAALPWDVKPEPESGIIKDFHLDLGVDPKEHFARVAADSQATGNEAIIAKVYQDVKCWLVDIVGLTTDYVLLQEEANGGFIKKQYKFTLLPLGKSRMSVKFDYIRQTTSSSVSSSSTTRHMFVFEPTGGGEPINAILYGRIDQRSPDDDTQAFLTFINSRE